MAGPLADIKILPGRKVRTVRIHFFVHDPQGAVARGELRPEVAGFDGVRVPGRIACNGNRDPSPTLQNNVWRPVPLSDDVRAVTCPECLATPEAKKMFAELAEIEEIAHHAMPPTK